MKYNNVINAINSKATQISNKIMEAEKLVKNGNYKEASKVLKEANGLIDGISYETTTGFYKDILALNEKIVDNSPKTYKLVVERVEDNYGFDSPREWDNLGTMICWHRRYCLGDNHNYDEPYRLMEHLAYMSDEDEAEKLENKWNNYEISEGKYVEELQKIAEKEFMILPLYLYDHGILRMSVGDFGDKWDSGQVGFIYVSYKTIEEECGLNREQAIKRAEEVLKSEVKVYDNYLVGDVYEAIIEEYDFEGNYIGEYDRCGGFYGDDIYENGIADNWDYEKLRIELNGNWVWYYERD